MVTSLNYVWVDFNLAGVLEELDIMDDVIMVLTVAEGPQARPIFYKNAMNKVTWNKLHIF